MTNVIKIDFNQPKRMHPKALFLRGGLAERRIHDEAYIKYRYALKELKELWAEIARHTERLDELLTLRQSVKVNEEGGQNYFHRARAAKKISKNSKVLHYAQLIISLESLYHAYSEDAAKAKAALK